MITVVVHDEPKPQGSKVGFISRGTGRAVVKDDNKPALRAWRNSVEEATTKARGDQAPLEGPVLLAVTFTMKKPLSRPKTRFTMPDKKPDLDKLLRSTMDGLKMGGAYVDDAQVVEIVRLAKFYPVTGGQPMPLANAQHMFSMTGTRSDILDVPGSVIRVASVMEFPPLVEGWF